MSLYRGRLHALQTNHLEQCARRLLIFLQTGQIFKRKKKVQDFNSGKLKFSETLVPSSFLLTNNKTTSLKVTNLLNFGW